MIYSSLQQETVHFPLDVSMYEAKLNELIDHSTFRKPATTTSVPPSDSGLSLAR